MNRKERKAQEIMRKHNTLSLARRQVKGISGADELLARMDSISTTTESHGQSGTARS